MTVREVGLLLAGLAIAATGGWAVMREHDAAVAARALADRERKAVDSLVNALDASETSRKALVVAHAAIAERLDSANKRTELHDTTLAETGRRVDSSLATRLDTSGRVLLDSLRAIYEGRLLGKDSIIAREQSKTRDALSDLAACNKAADDLRGALDRARKLAEDYRKLSRPGLLKRIVAGLPWATGGGLVVAILRGG